MAPQENAELEMEDGLVVYAGPSRTNSGSVPTDRRGNPYPPAPLVIEATSELTIIDVDGGLVTPGLIDPHTHALYGGDRASETALKLAGVPYLEILARGGGILSTVRATRDASDEELYEATATRLRAMLAMGTTTVEIKSGYGLSTEAELRTLRIVGSLARDLAIDIVPTFLGAHAVPLEYRDNPNAYVDLIVSEMLPAVVEQGIARFCDVFCEQGVFSVEQSRRILDAARELGLERKIHADEMASSPGEIEGAQVAAEVGAISADHLRATTPEGFNHLVRGGVVPVLLPATAFNLRDHQYPDARAMIDDYDLPVALSTDDNPGTSPTESLQFVMTLAALQLRMTPEEILVAVTTNAARALQLEGGQGTLRPGSPADAVVWQAYELGILPYRFGVNQATTVIKNGAIVSKARPETNVAS